MSKIARDWRWQGDKQLDLYVDGELRVILRKVKMDASYRWDFYRPDGTPLMAGSQLDFHVYRISKRSAQSSAEMYADTGVCYP